MYQDAKTAVEMKAPAMKLTMVIESAQDYGFIPRLIPLLVTWPLAEILEEPFVAPLLPPLLERHQRSIAVLKERIESKDQTLFFDITDHDLEGYNKFVPYYLHPESIYSVGLSKSSFRVKVSVGSNPWAPAEPTVNLAKVCERYGGGGHARVGAISFGVTEEEAARKAAREIADELRASVRASRSLWVTLAESSGLIPLPKASFHWEFAMTLWKSAKARLNMRQRPMLGWGRQAG